MRGAGRILVGQHGLRLGAGAILAVLSTGLLAWGLWPSPRVVELLHTDWTPNRPMQSDANTTPSEDEAMLPGEGSASAVDIVLDYPASVRVGDLESVRLQIRLDSPNGPAPSVVIPGDAGARAMNAITSGPDLPTIVAEALLDLPGARVLPYETISEPMAGRSAGFVWSVTITDTAEHHGTAWAYLLVVEQQMQFQERRAISAQSVKVEGRTLLGFGGPRARLVGGLGVAGGALIAFPFLGTTLRRFSDQSDDEA